MSNLIKHECPNCGAPINMSTLHCDYCGAVFERDRTNDYHLIVAREPMARTYSASIDVSHDQLAYFEKDHLNAMVKIEIMNQLTKDIAENVEYDEWPNFETNSRRVTGRIRIVPPGVRLG